jgi:hypothetical protein
MNPKYAAQINDFVVDRYADFCRSSDQHDDHKQTLTELAESAAVVDILKNALIEAQNALEDAKTSVEALASMGDGEPEFGQDERALESINKALATITEALKEVDE